MSGSAQTLFLDAMFHDLQRPMLLVVDNLHHMHQVTDDLANVIPQDELYEFPVEELIAAEVATSSPHYRAQRVRALHALQTGKPVVVVTSVSGIRRMLPAPSEFKQAQINVKRGDNFKLEHLRLMLHQMGYSRKNFVSGPGEFSIRGSIVDVYPLNADYPVRIDFFDTEVDSLRIFNVSDQTSINKIDSFKILPATDFVLTDAQRQSAAKKVNTRLHNAYKTIKNNKLKRMLTANIKPIIQGLQKGATDNQWLLYANDLYGKAYSIMDYLPKQTVLIFNDYSRLIQSNKQIVQDELHWTEGKLEAAQIISGTKFSLDFRKQCQRGNFSQLFFALFKKTLGGLKIDQIQDIQARTMQHFWGKIPLLKTEAKVWAKDKQTVVIMVANKKRMQKITNDLDTLDMKATPTNWDHIIPQKFQIIPERLNNGFIFKDANLVVVTESELFNQVRHHQHRRQTFANAQRIKSYTDIKPGDYVVHVNHGIGKYLGMKTIKIDGKHRDYLSIAYRNNAKLFVPVTQLNLIQKYVSAEDRHPRINKLGGKSWARTKKRVASRVEDIAGSLITLYAKRSHEKGYAFPPDDARQKQFEANFQYKLTPDQARSVDEIKADMEKPHPMDRLLVGDVGYGKTEVALRAAFKAVEGHKQVALLVPTTVLAHQHYETMKHRFKGFHINVGVLSRFRTPKQIRETIKGMKDGSVDVVVGTHRLLSKDVGFKDLGLLIIDEEQRFGVKHKNKIKQMKSSIDVLTLTATPIPRTLNMSMIGLRDLSIIETPPTNRLPIQTYVMEENDGAIQDGITRELERGGQVFFLHNRVGDIERTVKKLHKLVPKARIAYIDGQMDENVMEDTLFKFIHKKFNVLVTTTIIGNGVDIPNANTLFVENADHMGLSQLYQIRGRVGRSNRVAYAYLMYKPNKVLSPLSEKRLEAIRDFTELGSGFKIAMRDLSLRGAGNLLGKQQHGFINSVGYDMYTQMLNDAVAKKQGSTPNSKANSTVMMNVEAYLPTSYIGDSQQKIEMYKRLREMSSDAQFNRIKRDMVDRFGKYPAPVRRLLAISHIKMAADHALVDNVHRLKNKITVIMSTVGTNLYSSADFLRAIARTQFKASIDEKHGKMQMILTIQPFMVKKETWLDDIYKLIESLSKRRDELGKSKSKSAKTKKRNKKRKSKRAVKATK
ncbi:transcription-repair coupling factor [uncultured bacterium]|uniref:Transcription-repair-coupling factor n=2 Tax=Acetilactobacillus jinshanensis TaxID=1720083 RepID=A0A4P6ZMD0_9LACO|nr:transcription-repair coupling factor [Acetilactobacillus jinshanensis]URL61871.1 transcription-repair coupling factor [uncultured bacterium]